MISGSDHCSLQGNFAKTVMIYRKPPLYSVKNYCIVQPTGQRVISTRRGMRNVGRHRQGLQPGDCHSANYTHHLAIVSITTSVVAGGFAALGPEGIGCRFKTKAQDRDLV